MNRDERIKRLLFRSSHRGTKESDLVLGPYAQAHAPTMSDGELSEFEALLEEGDNDIWDWLSGAATPTRYHILLEKLRHFSMQVRQET